MYSFFNGKYYFDIIYNHYFISMGFKLSYIISKEIDRGSIELLGPYGLSNVLTNTGINLAKLDTGIITTYSLYITLGLLSLLFIVFAPILIDTSIFTPISGEFRLIIIYVTALFLLLSSSK
jgi:NADH-ubiquinone oxidoreductase chain 5